jgi:hypothetical protein
VVNEGNEISEKIGREGIQKYLVSTLSCHLLGNTALNKANKILVLRDTTIETENRKVNK